MRIKNIGGIILAVSMAVALCGCVNQNPESGKSQTTIGTGVEAAKAKVNALGNKPRIIATSPATAQICDKLDLDLVGVCSSSISKIPKRYKNLKTIGTAMSPDMEIVASLKPDWILSPSSLQEDLQPKYENINTDWAF